MMRFYVPGFTGRNPRSSPPTVVFVFATTSLQALETKHFCHFDYTFPERNLPAGGAVRAILKLAVLMTSAILSSDRMIWADAGTAELPAATSSKAKKSHVAAARRKFE